MITARCPACGSMDISETVPGPRQRDDGKNAECLDCFFRWTAGGRAKRRTYPRNALKKSVDRSD